MKQMRTIFFLFFFLAALLYPKRALADGTIVPYSQNSTIDSMVLQTQPPYFSSDVCASSDPAVDCYYYLDNYPSSNYWTGTVDISGSNFNPGFTSCSQVGVVAHYNGHNILLNDTWYPCSSNGNTITVNFARVGYLGLHDENFSLAFKDCSNHEWDSQVFSFFDILTLQAAGTPTPTPTPQNQASCISSIANATINEGDTYSATGSFTDSDSTSWT